MIRGHAGTPDRFNEAAKRVFLMGPSLTTKARFSSDLSRRSAGSNAACHHAFWLAAPPAERHPRKAAHQDGITSWRSCAARPSSRRQCSRVRVCAHERPLPPAGDKLPMRLCCGFLSSKLQCRDASDSPCCHSETRKCSLDEVPQLSGRICGWEKILRGKTV